MSGLSREEYEQLRDAAGTPRERLVVRLIGEAGVQPAEQTRIRPGDVDRRRFDGIVSHFLSVRDGGGERSRRTYLPANLARTIDEYAATTGTAPDGRLIDVTPRRVQMIVSEVASRAAETTGEDRLDGVSSDELRRYFAKRLLTEEEIDPGVVRAVGGWGRLESLEGHLDPPDDAEIAAAFADSLRDSAGGPGLAFGDISGTAGIELDADGRIVGGNGDLEALTGYDRAALVGTPFGRLFTGDARERARPKRCSPRRPGRTSRSKRVGSNARTATEPASRRLPPDGGPTGSPGSSSSSGNRTTRRTDGRPARSTGRCRPPDNRSVSPPRTAKSNTSTPPSRT